MTADPFLIQPLPSAPETEKSILGAILLDAALMEDAIELLPCEVFFIHANRRVFNAMKVLYVKQIPITFPAVLDELRGRNELEQVGGMAYVSSLVDGVPSLDSLENPAAVLQAKFTRRQLIQVANRIIGEAMDGGFEDSEVIERAQQSVFDITAMDERKSFEPASVVVGRTLERIEACAEGEDRRIKTGLLDLDCLIGGFKKQNQIIIAANTSMGKTGLSLCIARNAARAGLTVGYVSSEMSGDELGVRLLSIESRIDSRLIDSGDLKREEWGLIADANRRIAEYSLHIDESAGLTVAQFRAKLRKLMATTGADLCIMDYLGLMKSATKESRNQAIGEISRDTKQLAKELDMPLILLSQLNRENQRRSDPRPQLSDLRDSGDIEQNADMVIFIHRDAYYSETPQNANIAELIVAKNRNGATGLVKSAFVKHLTLFADLQR
jgi:replicative DNA helicase